MIMMGCLFSLAAFSQQNTLVVNVNHVKGTSGVVRAALFNKADQFLDEPWKSTMAQINNGSATLQFKDIPPGNYAISVMHDENNNDELDSNFLGLPKEGFGFSNNAMGTFGPPKFKEAAFEVPADTITIKMKYL